MVEVAVVVEAAEGSVASPAAFGQALIAIASTIAGALFASAAVAGFGGPPSAFARTRIARFCAAVRGRVCTPTAGAACL